MSNPDFANNCKLVSLTLIVNVGCSHDFHLSVGYAFINFEDVSELDTIFHHIELTLFQPIDIIDVRPVAL